MAAKWDVEFLEAARQRGDAEADPVVAEMMGLGEITAGEMYGKIVSVTDSVPKHLCDDPRVSGDVLAFLEHNDPPAWVDLEQVLRGQHFYARHGLECNLILLCGSLPTCYAAAKGAQALDASHQITKQVRRRVIETLRFLMAVMEPGNLARGGVGAITAKKIRLLHTLNRYILLNDPDMRYDRAALDVPLNQEDLAMTLMSFSVTVLDGLERLNVEVSAGDEADYFHAWRYVGWLMGIEEGLLPENADDGRRLLAAIAKHQYGPSAAGRELTKSLMDFMEEMVPGRAFDGLIPGKVRFLVGDATADILAVPPSDWTRAILKVAQFVHGVEHALGGDARTFSWFTDYFGRTVMHEIEKVIRNDGRPMFHVPDALREKWDLPPHPQAPTHAVVAAPEPVRPPTDAAAPIH